MALSFLKRSQTTFQVSKHLIPLLLLTGFSCLVVLGTYAFIFYPAQVRLDETVKGYALARQVQTQKERARDTQEVLAELWKGLPAQKDFTRLSVSIASLAKAHNVRIPGMGYDIQPFRHDLATKGILSFEVAGPYKAIRQFIFQLESKWPYVFIEKLSVERSKKSQDVAFKIHVSTFLREGTPPDRKGQLHQL